MIKLSRRSLLKYSALAAGSLMLNGCGVKEVAVKQDPDKETKPVVQPVVNEKIYRSACNPECNHCAFSVYVRNGRVVRLAPDPDFKSKPCSRGYSRLQWTYHPDRLKYPMKQIGEKGSGEWVRISWDEALDTIAEKLNAIKEEHGPEAVLFTGGAILSRMPGQARGRFANVFGEGVTTGIRGGLCCNAQGEAGNATVGVRAAFDESYHLSKFIINWGFNPSVTYLPRWKFISEAMENGAKMVTIDPRRSETAEKSNDWISIRPGMDTAMALGMIKVIIEENLYDKEFALNKTNLPFLVDKNTNKLLRGDEENTYLVWDNAANMAVTPDKATDPVLEGEFTVNGAEVRTVFTGLIERVDRFTPEYVYQVTGVDGNKMVELARTYASIKPAMINSGMSGAQRTTHGEQLIASLIYLAALTGNLDQPGGGVNDTGGYGSAGTTAGIGGVFKSETKGSLRASALGADLLADKPYPIKAAYWVGKGISQVPGSLELQEALKRLDFLVVQEHFFGDAADVADIVLPVTHIFEHHDLICVSRDYYYKLMDKAIEPLWECKSDMQIFTDLAHKMGLGEYFDKTDEEWCNEQLKPTGLTTEYLRQNGPSWAFGDPKRNSFGLKLDKEPFTWFKDTPFLTASGRMEFHSVRWEDKGIEPMADFYFPEECVESDPELVKKYPLALVNAKIRRTVHSTFAFNPWVQEVTPEAWVDLNEEDAKARNIKDGDKVEVFNDRGSIEVLARVHSNIRQGVASVQNGWQLKQGGCASILSNQNQTAIASGHTLNSTSVQVRGII